MPLPRSAQKWANRCVAAAVVAAEALFAETPLQNHRRNFHREREIEGRRHSYTGRENPYRDSNLGERTERTRTICFWKFPHFLHGGLEEALVFRGLL